MYILLRTKRVWQIVKGFSPNRLLELIHLITSPGDVIALACLNPSVHAFNQLSELEITSQVSSPTYGDSFSLNRKDFPNGKAFHIPLSVDRIKILQALCQTDAGSLDKDLYFDHLIIYRPGTPLVPLVNFHDAFSGGDLYSSGLYEQRELESFLELLASTAIIKENLEGVG